MGIYLNPGKESFEEAIRSEIFVDKTPMIRYLNTVIKTRQKYVSVSRPRRFGKTTAADMICAYYEREADGRAMFERTRLAREEAAEVQGAAPWDQYLGKFDVIRFVMTDFIKRDLTVQESLKKLTGRILRDLGRAYPDVKYDPDDFTYSLEEFYYESRTLMVIIIDEWDAIFRIRKDDREGQTEYLNFLRDWLKDKQYIALAYMTGILPIKKYGEHSALNMFDEYSMIAPMQLARFTGFTEEEVSDLCRQYGRDFDRMKDWYDGYLVSDAIPSDPEYQKQKATGQAPKAHRYSIYSPLSVVNALRFGQIRNYWNSTETYEALAEYIRMNFDGLKSTIALLMDGGRSEVDLSTYQNDMTTFHSRDDILALLIHLGYLGYDDATGEVFIPNKEILDVFKASTKSQEWKGVFQSFETSKELLKATWVMDAERVADLLEQAHDQASNKTYNSEAALSYSIQLAYYAAENYYTKILELDSGKGYADIVYLPSPKYPGKPALLIELKYEKNAATALDQIKRQRYPESLEHYKGNILLVAINYNREVPNDKPKFKHHSCVIERA